MTRPQWSYESCTEQRKDGKAAKGLQATAQVTMGSMLLSSQSCRWAKHHKGGEHREKNYGPRALVKHKHPDD